MKRVLLISILLFLILTLELYIATKYYTYPRLNLLFKGEYFKTYSLILAFPQDSELASIFENKILEKYTIARETHSSLTLEMFAQIVQDSHMEVLINICEIPNIDLEHIELICIARIIIRISIIMIFTILFILGIFSERLE